MKNLGYNSVGWMRWQGIIGSSEKSVLGKKLWMSVRGMGYFFVSDVFNRGISTTSR